MTTAFGNQSAALGSNECQFRMPHGCADTVYRMRFAGHFGEAQLERIGAAAHRCSTSATRHGHWSRQGCYPNGSGSGSKGVPMRKIKILIAMMALTVAVGIPTAVMAASGSASSALDLQAAKFTTTTQTTSSTTFRAINGLSGLTICALHQVTGTLSAQLKGAPAGFQIRFDGGPIMQPGAIRFVPAADFDSNSFTFVTSVGPFEASDVHAFDVEWRSPTGKSTTLTLGTFNLQYQEGTQGC
jgi:hypothetical protein